MLAGGFSRCEAFSAGGRQVSSRIGYLADIYHGQYPCKLLLCLINPVASMPAWQTGSTGRLARPR